MTAKTPVTEAAAEYLYSQGWRVESTILDGPRIVRDFSYETGMEVYATVVPTQSEYVWGVWSWGSGQHLAGGREFDAGAAAGAAAAWVDEEVGLNGDN